MGFFRCFAVSYFHNLLGSLVKLSSRFNVIGNESMFIKEPVKIDISVGSVIRPFIDDSTEIVLGEL